MMNKGHVPLQGIRYRHYALLTANTTVTKEIDFPWKGDVIAAETIRDYELGLYGFQSVQSRDKFVSRMNASNELRPCIAVLLQGL